MIQYLENILDLLICYGELDDVHEMAELFYVQLLVVVVVGQFYDILGCESFLLEMDFKGFHVPDYFFKPETDVVFLGNKASTD